MRYSIRDPFEYETGDAPVTPPTPPTPPTMTDKPEPKTAPVEMAPAPDPTPVPVPAPVPAPPVADVAPPPDDDALVPAPVEPLPPPLWMTADDQVLHMPPQMIDRALRRRRWRPWSWGWQRRWRQPGPWLAPSGVFRPAAPVFQPGAPFIQPGVPFSRRPGPAFAPTVFRPRRRAMIDAVGRLVRAARRVGTVPSRATRAPLPVFRSHLRGRPFRIVTRPRGGLRHEIVSIEPEIGNGELGEIAGTPMTSPGGGAVPDPGVIFGIDEASVDGNKNANWARVRDEGRMRFAIIRSNFGVWEDRAFKRDWPKIKEAGLVRGPYLFLRYGVGKGFDPVAQAQALIKTVGPLGPGDLPPTLDVEFPGGRAKTGLTAKQCMAATRAAWKVLKDHYGVAPIIYTSARVWHEDLNDSPAPDLVESPLWVTRYIRRPAGSPFVRDPKLFAQGRFDPRVPTPWGDASNWWIHQYQGDARGLPGFNQVDMNRFNTMTGGAKGDRVKWVQRRLGVPQSGMFDAATAAALNALKQKVGLPPGDVIDPRTFAFLCWLSPAGRTDSPGELDEMFGEGEFGEGEFGEGEFGEGEFGEGEFDEGLFGEGEFAEGEEEGYLEPEIEGETRPARSASPVKARILWPALGFPAVVGPSSQPSTATLRDGDATKCVCVLIVSDKPGLSPSDAARYLRCVPWDKRGTRHIAAHAFAAADLAVRDASALILSGRKDEFGQQVRFGVNGQHRNGITALLSSKVLDLYRNAGLPYLYEVRLSETATARLQNGQYHLFWNNERPGESAPSDEMALLVERHARPERAKLGQAWAGQREFLIQEYLYEYGGLHAPYNRFGAKQTAAEILHPLFIRRDSGTPLRIGHVTDTHVDVRADVYEHNIITARRWAQAKNPRHVIAKCGDYNNFNRSFCKVYSDARKNSDLLLMTGDLIDYGRGHWGVSRPNQVEDDTAYHADRNWFLFYYLIASGTSYTQPAYTILGNHDWRLNPYPPFAPGAPSPNELLNDHMQLSFDQQKSIIETAHGPGHKRGFSYTNTAESAAGLIAGMDLATIASTLVKLFSQTTNLVREGYPTETSVKSIAWYLLSINPFLDYTFSLPSRQSVLMLDWAEKEDVLLPKVENGEKKGYNPLFPGDAAGTPRSRNNLTALQHQLVSEFVGGPSRSKIVGVHAPPIGPYGDWHDADLMQSRKTYPDPDKARGPKDGHPLFAVSPGRHVTIPYGMVADRGSLGNADERDWFIRTLSDPRYFVRLVLSGHIHRNALYLAYQPDKPIEVTNPKDPWRRHRVEKPLLVGSLYPQAARGTPPFVTADRRKGPLYVTTTSGGPRGGFEKRALTAAERAHKGTTTDPGYSRLEIAGDGTIIGVKFIWGLAPAEKPKSAIAVPTDVAVAMC